MTSDPVKQSLGELQWLVRCRCDPAYTSRNLRDPDCNCDNAEAVKIVTDRIEAQAAEIEWYRDRVVWGFYEDETPKFYQGKEGEHEICEPVSAKEVSNYISEIERLKAALERGLSMAKGIEMACLGLRDEAQPMTAKEAARKMIAELTGDKP